MPTRAEEEAERNRKNRSVCFSILGCVGSIILGVSLAMFLLRGDNGDNSDNLREPPQLEHAPVFVTLDPVPTEMTSENIILYETAGAVFFQNELRGVSNVQVTLVSQQRQRVTAVDGTVDEAVNVRKRSLQSAEDDDQLRPLETLLNVSALVDNAPFSTRILAAAILRESETFLGTLPQNFYFNNVEQVAARSVAPETGEGGGGTNAGENGVDQPIGGGGDSGNGDDDAEDDSSPQQPRCNGLSNLCDIPVNEILFGTLHHADADSSSFRAFFHHEKNFTTALYEGHWRGLHIAMDYCTGQNQSELVVIHGTCERGTSDPFFILAEVLEFLVKNPDEVIIMPVQLGSGVGMQAVYDIVQQVEYNHINTDNTTRLADILYNHDTSSDVWPTLKKLIDVNQRLLFFLYNGLDNCATIDCPPGFHDWFQYAVETSFSFQSVNDILNDTQTACAVDRGRATSTKDFYAINLFLENPNVDAAREKLNNATFLLERLEVCAQVTNLRPNLVLHDFWSEGNVMDAVNDYNKRLVPPTPAPVGAPSVYEPSVAPTTVPSTTPSVIPSLSPTIVPSATPIGTPTTVPEPTTTDNSRPTRDPASPARLCNGHANLCEYPANEILFATMHNAFANPDIVPFAPNHDQDLMQGLNAGIRGLNLDIGKCFDGSLFLVHTLCLLGFAEPIPVFEGILEFLQDNPTEVLLMPVQINDETGGEVTVSEVYSMLESVTVRGQRFVDQLVLYDAEKSAWPTLRELIDMDRRVLFFIYNGAEECRNEDITCPPGIQDWFQYAAETEFQFSTVSDIQDDVEGACSLTRGAQSSNRDFFGINLFLQIPNRVASEALNEAAFLRSHLSSCSTLNDGLGPNALIVDFWSTGDLITVVNEYNAALPSLKVEPTPPTTAPSVQQSVMYNLICSNLKSTGSVVDCEDLSDPSTVLGRAFLWVEEDNNIFWLDENRLQRFALAALYYGTGGANWVDSTEWIGELEECDWFGVSCDSVGLIVELNLESNNLNGSLPAAMGLLSSIVTLTLDGNRLQGSIPRALSPVMEVINLSDNQLTGSLPSGLATAASTLQTVRLSQNQLSGITPEITTLFSAQTLDLGFNKLTSDSLSSGDLFKLTGLQVLMLNGNTLGGVIRLDLTAMTSLRILSLSETNLSGSIPQAIRNLRQLRSLDLSDNQLSGALPSGLGELPQLRDLYLQNNQLTGALPDELSDLQFLEFFRADSNQLTGSASTDFCTFVTNEEIVLYLDCDEVFAPCATYCCTDGLEDCVCRYEITDPFRCL